MLTVSQRRRNLEDMPNFAKSDNGDELTEEQIKITEQVTIVMCALGEAGAGILIKSYVTSNITTIAKRIFSLQYVNLSNSVRNPGKIKLILLFLLHKV